MRQYITKRIFINRDNKLEYHLGFEQEKKLYFDIVSKEEYEFCDNLPLLKVDYRKTLK